MNRDDDRGFWTVVIVLAITIVAVLHAYTGGGGGPPQAEAAAAFAPGRGIEEVPDTVAYPAPDSAQPTRIATVFECEQRGERVFSDRRCGQNAQERAIEAPNRMDAPNPSVVELSISEPKPPSVTAPRVVPAAPESPRIQCREIEEEKERINSRMREGYGSAEGEVLRDRLRKLAAEYYDLRCHHFRK